MKERIFLTIFFLGKLILLEFWQPSFSNGRFDFLALTKISRIDCCSNIMGRTNATGEEQN